ncbi:MAG: Asp-tRNA(Asn)/Glu-tRNA(Gln) amidotransferase subunit GatC [Gammaproteobacteria bacterium]|jgi:aspartyl-tRNA(Asn)/glutamyl-tRNA(Gln) amidotransferase subunit C|nr:Asp-tRNA(Asn)/Glu-tRNA(Gln) amidotransferase subunit GatC [Gammaproteobacteria bacterium]MBU0772912.1 Asp-tRNA(Asn)/Glu-tRNA(Gln) amidotransferase subunit GatC [Gammaproteobacteria bacterium]MBU0856172.1 Asp-tRNA(Asn)/Glu-tRNA(Gln) amidotransferase subunit GatC [Gammaproteobacteria bacterium]MBU1848311.1 Asp-tRNA(Asn)/Glu-tRNA(Gln) amidotransferase subunit GatC [Gammaproteobacteria bacterium]
MSLTDQEVRHIAKLARIELADAQLDATRSHLNSMLGLIEQLQSIDTTGVEPMAHATDLTLRLRDDRVTETDHRAAYQSVAPAVEGGLYLVPRVIE